MNDVKSCLLVGVGGQGAILISKIMSNGFMKAGYDVKQSEVHGMAQRGGSVSTQVRWGDTEPPRWAMPCTSLCFTSNPACMKPLDMIREIRMAP